MEATHQGVDEIAVYKDVGNVKECSTCKYCQHPAWAILIAGYMICVHPKACGIGRLDIQRSICDDNHCGPLGNWYEVKNLTGKG